MKLSADGLSFTYPNGAKIFKNVSFSVNRGEIFCILGPNGIGKTTLLNCMANQLKPNDGEVKLGSRNIREMKDKEFACYVGYVPQFHNPVFAYTVEEFVVMGRAPHLGTTETPKARDYETAKKMISMLQIDHLAHKSYLEISGGERQLVLFAQVLTQQPGFLILDEPTSHLDFGNQIKTLRLIDKLASEENLGILLTSHDPNNALMFKHNVGIMSQGEMVSVGNAIDVITKENMERIYRIQLEIEKYEKEPDRYVCIPLN